MSSVVATHHACAWYQREYSGTPAPYSSQGCPRCHLVDAHNRRNQAEFRCVKCDYRCPADLVGGENSRHRGLAPTVEVGDTARSPVNRRGPALPANNQNGGGSQPPLLMFTGIHAPVRGLCSTWE